MNGTRADNMDQHHQVVTKIADLINSAKLPALRYSNRKVAKDNQIMTSSMILKMLLWICFLILGSRKKIMVITHGGGLSVL